MELMVVLVIIALLAGVVGINVKGYVDRSRQRKALTDLAVLHAQIKAFYADEGRYPTRTEGLRILMPKYIEQLSLDPWGRPYQYENPGRQRPFDIISLGADGREGGEDENSDLTNWDVTQEQEE